MKNGLSINFDHGSSFAQFPEEVNCPAREEGNVISKIVSAFWIESKNGHVPVR